MQTEILRSRWRTGVLVAMLALSGCASMSKNECLTVDWRTVGFEDGAAGYPADRIGQHRKACAKHGVTPDLAAYQSGREQGLREYCRPQNGFRVGSRGSGYDGSCPADMDEAFTRAYESGRQLYTLESRVADVNYRMESKRQEINAAEQDIVTNSALAVSKDATAEERAAAVVDVKQLAERVGRLRAEIPQLEVELSRCEQDLEDYRAHLEYPQ